MSDNLKRTADVYFDLFSIMMRYNHKVWRTSTLPLPANHFIVLVNLYNNDGEAITITQLAKQLSISKQQMSPIIDKLLKKELIEKKSLTKDRRFSYVRISDKGIKFMEEHRDEQKEHFSKWLVDIAGKDVLISDADIQKFDESVKVVNNMMKKMFNMKR